MITSDATRRRRRLVFLFAAAAVVLFGCRADTDPATGVAETSAKLNGTVGCGATDTKRGELFFQYQRVGASTWADGIHRGFDCRAATADVPVWETVTGLESGRDYRVRLAVDLDPQGAGGHADLWFDGNGTPNGTNYDKFTTLPELAIPRGGASGFGQAADFYDSVGVNTHFWAVGTQYTPNWNSTAYQPALNRLAELGVRHIRDMTVGSWYDWRFHAMRPAYLALAARNRNLPQGRQPIFLMGGTGDWNTSWGGPVQWRIPDWFPIFDGGHQHYNGDPGVPAGGRNIPGVGAPIPDGATGAGTVPKPWAFADAEIPWALMDALQGPNEPAGSTAQLQQLRPWMAAMTAGKEARTSPVVVGGLPHVTEKGVSSTPARADELPTVGVAPTSDIWGTLGDWSKGTNVVDMGDLHVYWGGHEPSLEGFLTQIANADSYNGDLRPTPDRSKALPMMISETGYISRGTSGAVTRARAGFWPAPDDVIAEYLVRSLLLGYRVGYRRTYVYELMDQVDDAADAERNFGLVRYDGAPKAQFYAIRNLLAIVGFSQAQAADRAPIAVSISGFSPGPTNKQTVALDPSPEQPIGHVYYQSQDRLDTLLLQQSADTYLYFVWRQASLWDREPGNRNPRTGAMQSLGDVAAGRKTPGTQNLTVKLPPGVESVSVAQPTAGGALTPSDGQRFWPLAMNGNTVPLQMGGKAKVLKIVMAR